MITVVPDKRSEAERRAGTHHHREKLGEDSWLPAHAITAPWGYESLRSQGRQ
ncbi:hypothetical protein ABIG06_006994 [Bradyrhizobium sp. USDA 326]